MLSIRKIHEILIKKYGHTQRIDKTISEMHELERNLLNSLYLKEVNNTKDITEEIADVRNMLDNVMVLYGIDIKNVKKIQLFKLKRTLDRIGINEAIDKGDFL